ncbi:hypothetical protein MVEN_00312200 [Mycena venus]|uniref:Uncharacterized protein n=1 Tax=Mycena venus TaxID=2733690 RepID=A0A8H6Z2T3_9AGAR|nr:hypothetical protein MVEN_00312200 [Mycena venus]
MPSQTLLKTLRARLRRTPDPKTISANAEQKHQKLAILVSTLTLAEKAAEASPVPYLKGAIGFALEVVKCVQGYRSNNEDLNRLAVSCGTLVMDITKQRTIGGELSENMEQLVQDLCRTLEEVQNTAKDIVNSDSGIRRFLAQNDNSERLRMLFEDVKEAQRRFTTLVLIVTAQNQEQGQDVYDHNSIVLGSCYDSGEGWIAFHGKLQGTEENVIVKRYQTDDVSRRRAMHEADIKAFKEFWHSNLLQYLGRSRPGVSQPYTILRGVTSDHVSNYIALRFAEDSQRGSVEALRLLRDLTNALAFTVGTTNSSSFDISKVHLNDSGNLVVVNLEPVLVVHKGTKDDMPYWRSWQEICIELLAGDPLYEPNPSIEYDADPGSHRRLEYLRPILGHVHYGGARFKETSIEMAFKSEGLVLSQVHRELQASLHDPLAPPDAQVRHALWRRARELHYVAHYREPLDIDIGDIGYITGDKFIRLDNVQSQISDGWNHGPRKAQAFRFVPDNQWTTSTVAGIIRHEFRFPTGAVHLTDWRGQRPRLTKDFMLRRINSPREPGLVVDCSEAWKVLAERAPILASDHTERPVSASNLILVVYFKQQSGYATFRLNRNLDAEQWRDIWTKEGLASPPDSIYFYESPPGGPTGVWGYFSLSPLPGTPFRKWTPDRDGAGEAWGWTFQSEDWTVEISKPNIKQYIRYVQL